MRTASRRRERLRRASSRRLHNMAAIQSIVIDWFQHANGDTMAVSSRAHVGGSLDGSFYSWTGFSAPISLWPPISGRAQRRVQLGQARSLAVSRCALSCCSPGLASPPSHRDSAATSTIPRSSAVCPGEPQDQRPATSDPRPAASTSTSTSTSTSIRSQQPRRHRVPSAPAAARQFPAPAFSSRLRSECPPTN